MKHRLAGPHERLQLRYLITPECLVDPGSAFQEVVRNLCDTGHSGQKSMKLWIAAAAGMLGLSILGLVVAPIVRAYLPRSGSGE